MAGNGKGKRSSAKDLRNENARLKRENDRLKLKLAKAEGLIELQKKVSEMLDLNRQEEQTNGSFS